MDPSDFLKVIDALPRAQRGKGWEGAYTRIKADELEADESWIELRRGRITLLDLAELPTRSLARGPLVILNMCESAQVVPTLAGGFVDAFMGAGAVAVIGTETSVPPTFAHPFVLRVLASFLGGAPIGTALLDARNAYSRQSDLLGLAYTLYGSGRLAAKGVPEERLAQAINKASNLEATP